MISHQDMIDILRQNARDIRRLHGRQVSDISTIGKAAQHRQVTVVLENPADHGPMMKKVWVVNNPGLRPKTVIVAVESVHTDYRQLPEGYPCLLGTLS